MRGHRHSPTDKNRYGSILIRHYIGIRDFWWVAWRRDPELGLPVTDLWKTVRRLPHATIDSQGRRTPSLNNGFGIHCHTKKEQESPSTLTQPLHRGLVEHRVGFGEEFRDAIGEAIILQHPR